MSTHKGDIAEIAVIKDLLKRGYNIALPIGDDTRYDLVVERSGTFEKVQVKYSESDGKRVKARSKHKIGNIRSRKRIAYEKDEIDWLAIYDITTDQCFYLPKEVIGQGSYELRLIEAKNGQKKNIRWAKDFTNI